MDDQILILSLPKAVNITTETAAAETAGMPTATAQGASKESEKSWGTGAELESQAKRSRVPIAANNP